MLAVLIRLFCSLDGHPLQPTNGLQAVDTRLGVMWDFWPMRSSKYTQRFCAYVSGLSWPCGSLLCQGAQCIPQYSWKVHYNLANDTSILRWCKVAEAWTRGPEVITSGPHSKDSTERRDSKAKTFRLPHTFVFRACKRQPNEATTRSVKWFSSSWRFFVHFRVNFVHSTQQIREPPINCAELLTTVHTVISSHIWEQNIAHN
jgi:hypothetical protein